MAPARKTTKGKKAPNGCQSIVKFLSTSKQNSKSSTEKGMASQSREAKVKKSPKEPASNAKKSLRSKNSPTSLNEKQVFKTPFFHINV